MLLRRKFKLEMLGIAIAFLGAALAVAGGCLGSAKGVGIVGEAGAGLLCASPDEFSKVLILEVLPGTQGLYGLVIFFFALVKLGVFSGTIAPISISLGGAFLAACLPMALGGYLSAVCQGRAAAAGVNLIARQPESWSKGILLASMVEFYAILSLLASFLMLFKIG